MQILSIHQPKLREQPSYHQAALVSCTPATLPRECGQNKDHPARTAGGASSHCRKKGAWEQLLPSSSVLGVTRPHHQEKARIVTTICSEDASPAGTVGLRRKRTKVLLLAITAPHVWVAPAEFEVGRCFVTSLLKTRCIQ